MAKDSDFPSLRRPFRWQTARIHVCCFVLCFFRQSARGMWDRVLSIPLLGMRKRLVAGDWAAHFFRASFFLRDIKGTSTLPGWF